MLLTSNATIHAQCTHTVTVTCTRTRTHTHTHTHTHTQTRAHTRLLYPPWALPALRWWCAAGQRGRMQLCLMHLPVLHWQMTPRLLMSWCLRNTGNGGGVTWGLRGQGVCAGVERQRPVRPCLGVPSGACVQGGQALCMVQELLACMGHTCQAKVGCRLANLLQGYELDCCVGHRQQKAWHRSPP